MDLKCTCDTSCIITSSNIKEKLLSNEPCPKCENINISKFKPLEKQLKLEDIDNNFGKCECGNRPLDAIMTHVLKLMIKEGIDLKSSTLRNGALPLINPLYNSNKSLHIKKNSLIILHPKLNKKVAKTIINEINEVKGVLKGDTTNTVGIKDSNSDPIYYELLAGCGLRCDILNTPLGKIPINKHQNVSYIEFPPSMEIKIMKLYNYLENKKLNKDELSKFTILDGTCGNGSLGIFALKYGIKNLIFNDIWKISTYTTAMNLKANGYETNLVNNKDQYDNRKIEKPIAKGKKFKIFNSDIKKLSEKNITLKKIDLCIIDCFPGIETFQFEKAAKLIANDVLII